MGDPDLSSGGARPGPERPRGLVVLPALGEAGAKPAGEGQPSFLRRWWVLIATLLVGAVAVVLIVVLWSSAPAAPNPRSLPPPPVGQ